VQGIDSFSPAAIFDEISIVVESRSGPFEWNAIRGKGEDDFYEVVKWNVIALLKYFKVLEDPSKLAGGGQGGSTFLRDLLSACPSPLKGKQDRCDMHFSPMGTSCVNIDNKKLLGGPIIVDVSTSTSRNPRFVPFLVAGIVLFVYSRELSKSKIFQYTGGSSFFVFFGLLVLLLFAVSKVRKGGTIVAALASLGLYSYGLLYFLRETLQFLVTEFWEYVLGYIVVTLLAGIIFTNRVRSDDSWKHWFKVLIRWIIRIVGLSLVYWASASPRTSLAYMIIALVAYVMPRFRIGPKKRPADVTIVGGHGRAQ
jgi:NEMP family